MTTSSAGARYQVFSDMRWPEKTGIGNVMTAMVDGCPGHAEVVDLDVQGRIGSPLSPLAVSRSLRGKALDGGVFWSAGFVPPLWSPVPSVVTVHDLTHLHFYSRAHALYYRHFFLPLYRRCEAVVCVSDYTRREFIEWSGMPASRVHVVLNGVSPQFSANTETLGLPYRYVLYPGNHRSYKNLDRLVCAYARSGLRDMDVHLVMTGTENVELMNLARNEGVEAYVHFAGRLADADLPRVYRGAEAIAFVSLYEGFGLPIVEAMASGVPVLTSNVSAMPEVAGDAALIVDPYSVDDIARALRQLMVEPGLRAELAGRGREQVRRFDWTASADALWSIVDDVVSAGGRCLQGAV